MLSVLITRDMCNERKKCRAPGGSRLQHSHSVTILAEDLLVSDTAQISYKSQMFIYHLSVYFPCRYKNLIHTPLPRQSNSTGIGNWNYCQADL